MILKKAFYFVRHGQTAHNASCANLKEDHPVEIALNDVGRQQAHSIEPIIAALPIQTVCTSPLKRVLETSAIITSRVETVDHRKIDDLSECSSEIWNAMIANRHEHLANVALVSPFCERILRGINCALSFSGTPLVVAHGGTHFALCNLLNIQNHPWRIDNCVPVEFVFCQQLGEWQARKLSK